MTSRMTSSVDASGHSQLPPIIPASLVANLHAGQRTLPLQPVNGSKSTKGESCENITATSLSTTHGSLMQIPNASIELYSGKQNLSVERLSDFASGQLRVILPIIIHISGKEAGIDLPFVAPKFELLTSLNKLYQSSVYIHRDLKAKIEQGIKMEKKKKHSRRSQPGINKEERLRLLRLLKQMETGILAAGRALERERFGSALLGEMRGCEFARGLVFFVASQEGIWEGSSLGEILRL